MGERNLCRKYVSHKMMKGWELTAIVDNLCREMVGDSRGVSAGNKISGSADYAGNKLRANIWAVKGALNVSNRGCRDVLRHIQESCKRTDNSNGRPWTYGGEVYDNAQNLRAELWYAK